nr:hypothetical protein [Desulfobulbaceae bacterium]
MRLFNLTVILLILLLNSAYAGDVSSLVALAQSSSESGHHHESFETYWLAFRQEPDNIEINFNLGIEAAAISDNESAVMAFERVLLLDPGATQAKIELGKAFYKLGALKTARHYFSEVLSADDLPQQARINIQHILDTSGN